MTTSEDLGGPAPVAIQAGRHAGEQVARRIEGQPLTPFRYRDKGMMAVLGRGDAVAELSLQPGAGAGSRRPLRFGGLPAWVLWLGVHIVYPIGFRNRLKVLVDWGMELLHLPGGRSDPRSDARRTRAAGRAAPPVNVAASTARIAPRPQGRPSNRSGAASSLCPFIGVAGPRTLSDESPR